MFGRAGAAELDAAESGRGLAGPRLDESTEEGSAEGIWESNSGGLSAETLVEDGFFPEGAAGEAAFFWPGLPVLAGSAGWEFGASSDELGAEFGAAEPEGEPAEDEPAEVESGALAALSEE
jgi:hypothetical protein